MLMYVMMDIPFLSDIFLNRVKRGYGTHLFELSAGAIDELLHETAATLSDPRLVFA